MGDRPRNSTGEEWGDELMKQLADLRTPENLASFTADQLNSLRLFPARIRGKELSDADDEALPLIHVLARAEARAKDKVDRKGVLWDETVEQRRAVTDRASGVLRALLAAGVSPAVRGQYCAALEYALKAPYELDGERGRGASGVVRELLAQEESTQAQVGLLNTAVRSYDRDLIDTVMASVIPAIASTDPRPRLGSILETACTFRSQYAIAALLTAGASAEGKMWDKAADYAGNARPLHLAANQGSIECVCALVDAGADVHTRQVNGLRAPGNALHAVCHGCGVDKTSPNNINGALDVARFLIARGLDPNGPSVMEKKTPLQLAISGQFPDMIRFLLLEARVDPELNNAAGAARKHRSRDIGRVFDEAMEERARLSDPITVTVDVPPQPQVMEFPSEGEVWCVDGQELLGEGVVFDCEYGLCSSEAQEQALSGTPTSDSLRTLASALAAALAPSPLTSEAVSPYRPLYILQRVLDGSVTGPTATVSRRSSRRAGGQGARAKGVGDVRGLLQTVMGVGRQALATLALSEIMLTNKAAMCEFLGLAEAEPISSVLSAHQITSGSVFTVAARPESSGSGPVMFLVFTDEGVAGVYATRVET